MSHHPITPQTRNRWRRIAHELLEAAANAEAGDDTRERVGVLVVREALALNVSTEWREREDRGEKTRV